MPYKGRRMTLGLFGRFTSQRSQKADRREARQESIGAAPRPDKLRQFPQPDRAAGFERQVEPARAGAVGAYDRIVGAGDARILKTKIQPVAGHGLELGAEAGTNEVAEQAPFRLGLIPITLRRLIGWSIGHAAPNKAPAVIRYALHDPPAPRIAPADMGSIGAAGPINILKIRFIHVGIRGIRRKCQRRSIGPSAAQVGGEDLAQGTMTRQGVG